MDGGWMLDTHGRSPLHYAAAAGAYSGAGRRIARLLSELGDDAEEEAARPDAFGFRPLGYAAACGRVEAAGVLLDAGGAPTEVHTTQPFTAAHAAAVGGNLAVLRLLEKRDLLELGAALPLEAPHHASCLHIGDLTAALAPLFQQQHLYLPSLLQRVEASDGDADVCLGGMTPLHLAAVCGQAEAAELLLGVGADPLAVIGAGASLAEQLVPTVPSLCLVGGSALHAAALSGSVECWCAIAAAVRCSRRGVHIAGTTATGQTLVDLAALSGNSRVQAEVAAFVRDIR